MYERRHFIPRVALATASPSLASPVATGRCPFGAAVRSHAHPMFSLRLLLRAFRKTLQPSHRAFDAWRIMNFALRCTESPSRGSGCSSGITNGSFDDMERSERKGKLPSCFIISRPCPRNVSPRESSGCRCAISKCRCAISACRCDFAKSGCALTLSWSALSRAGSLLDRQAARISRRAARIRSQVSAMRWGVLNPSREAV